MAGEQIAETTVGGSPTPAAPTEQEQMASHAAALQKHIEDRAARMGVPVRARPTTPATTSSPSSPVGDETRKQEPPKPTPAATRLEELRDPRNERGIFAKDAKVQKEAMAEFNRLAAAEMSDEELAAITESSVEELRSRFGLGHRVPEYLAEQWDGDSERDVLATFASQGLSADQVAPVMSWYMQTFADAGGDVANIDADRMESEFRALGKRHGLPQALVDDLVKHERKRLGVS